ncbi:hypothetical protein C9374_001044 [Naegleria lovaniensis]|uniref:Uncharacterized protein n=1 Tax=Naegleria lovaniensis TaxID=51637 RepID=A0AA88KNN2_NAELO|nr:uncharacterized protein C9374_001044 [Naegleria lovaniensis]KAG2388194.1 hypothetical protein C9374_001044 [Naegleria lovaniensis]
MSTERQQEISCLRVVFLRKESKEYNNTKSIYPHSDQTTETTCESCTTRSLRDLLGVIQPSYNTTTITQQQRCYSFSTFSLSKDKPLYPKLVQAPLHLPSSI